MVYLQVFPNNFKKTIYLSLVLLPATVSGSYFCEDEAGQEHNRSKALKFKPIAIASILVAGGIGVSLPRLGKKIKALNPDNDIFFMIKAFAAGVILATGFVHILPDAFDTLTSPCLKENPWRKFPFAGFIAMMSGIGTLMVDSLASGYYKRMHFNKEKQVNVDEENVGGDEDEHEHGGHVHINTHAAHGHAHGSASSSSHDQQNGLADLLRRRVISQLGIIVHSVIIGITLGASESADTIRTLLAALSFHQAKFKSLHTTIMAVFFSLTTPVGIVVGIGISSVYHENSSTALIVQGVFNSASAGILIYMALVDLLAADFMDVRICKAMHGFNQQQAFHYFWEQVVCLCWPNGLEP